MPQKLFSALTLSLCLSGCSYNPFSSDNHLTGKPVGVAIGTTAGAGSAALAGASRTGVALAGLGGAAVGYYVTTIDFMSGGIKRAGGTVLTQGDCVTISLPTATLFDDNVATLRPEATPALKSTVDVLNDFPDNDILVAGNSSGYGTQKDEKDLTLRRAQKVAGYLWANGIGGFRSNETDKRKLLVTGSGHHFPIANSIQATGIMTNSHVQISSCPGTDELRADIDTTTDANIGRMEGPALPDRNVAASFKGDNLPPGPHSAPENFRPAFYDKDTQVLSRDLKHEGPGVLN